MHKKHLGNATFLTTYQGRKKTTLLGTVMMIGTTIGAAFTTQFYQMLAVRVVQGFGTFLLQTGGQTCSFALLYTREIL